MLLLLVFDPASNWHTTRAQKPTYPGDRRPVSFFSNDVLIDDLYDPMPRMILRLPTDLVQIQ